MWLPPYSAHCRCVFPAQELPELAWNVSALAVETHDLARIRQLLLQIPAGVEQQMRANAKRRVERMLYTTHEFSRLPNRGVPCSGCAIHRADCNGVRRDSLIGHHLAKKLQTHAAALHINVTTDGVCGRTSYIGEDGSNDAFEGLAEVLRRRLHAPPPPPEPWARLPQAALPSTPSSPVPTHSEALRWFSDRANWYSSQLDVVQPPTSFVHVHPPAQQHRDSLRHLLAL